LEKRSGWQCTSQCFARAAKQTAGSYITAVRSCCIRL